MQITKGTDAWKLAVMAAAGAIVAAGASFKVPKSFLSSAVIQVTPQPDPVRRGLPKRSRNSPPTTSHSWSRKFSAAVILPRSS